MERDMSGPRHIALVISALEGGGAERVVLVLAEEFCRRGHRVDLVVTNARGALLGQVPEGVTLIDLDAPRISKSLRPMASYLRRAAPDIILSSLTPVNMIAVAAKLLSRSRAYLALVEHNVFGDAESDGHRAGRLERIFLPWLYRRADRLIAVSDTSAANLAQHINAPEGQVLSIENPIDIDRIRRLSQAAPMHPWLTDPSKRTLIGVGRLVRQKGFDILINSLSKIAASEDLYLVIYGVGPEEEALRARIASYKLESRVDLAGFSDNPYAAMRAADLFVLSSRFEGFGLVLAEALLAGGQVLSTDCHGPIGKILNDGQYGHIVPAEGPETLANGIVAALKAPRPAPDETWSNRFDPAYVADRYLAAIGCD